MPHRSVLLAFRLRCLMRRNDKDWDGRRDDGYDDEIDGFIDTYEGDQVYSTSSDLKTFFFCSMLLVSTLRVFTSGLEM